MPAEVTNLEQFNRIVGDFCRKTVPEVAVTVHRRIVLEALKRVVMKTPVDTGRARGGWQTVILGKGEFVTALRKMAKRHQATDPEGSATVLAGAAIVERMKPFCIVDVENNVEYIIELEDGKSSQAPSGMVQLTLDELVRQFR